MTKPIDFKKSGIGYRTNELPRRLLLQRLDPATKTWGTLNDLSVTPFTEDGAADCAAELQRQQYAWDHNYQAFFNSEWRIQPVYSA